MTKNKKIILLYAPICLLGALFTFARPVKAFTRVLDQYNNASAIYSTYGTTAVAETFKPTKQNIAGFLTVQVVKQDNGTAIGYWLCRGLPNPATLQTTYNCGADNNELIANGIVSVTGTNVTIDFNITTPEPNYGEYWYYVALAPLDNKKAKFIFSPVGVSSSNQDQRGYGVGIPDGYAMYFQQFYDIDTTSKLFLIRPLGGVYSNVNLTNFDLALFVDQNNLSTPYTITIDYGTSTNSLVNHDTIVKTFDLGSWQQIAIPKTKNLINGFYYYRASAYRNSLLYATSTIETFEINNFAPAGDLEDFIMPTEAELCAGIDTDSFFGGIECGFKKVIAWAFYPSSGTVKDFEDRATNLKNDFPFNTLFGITGGIRSAIASTSLENSGFSIPMIKGSPGSSSYYMLPVLASTSVNKLIGNDNAQKWRLIQGIFIYTIFLSLVYFTVRLSL